MLLGRKATKGAAFGLNFFLSLSGARALDEKRKRAGRDKGRSFPSFSSLRAFTSGAKEITKKPETPFERNSIAASLAEAQLLPPASQRGGSEEREEGRQEKKINLSSLFLSHFSVLFRESMPPLPTAPCSSPRSQLPLPLRPGAPSNLLCAPVCSKPAQKAPTTPLSRVGIDRRRRRQTRRCRVASSSSPSSSAGDQVSSAERLSAELEQLAAADAGQESTSSDDELGVQLAKLRAQVREGERERKRRFPKLMVFVFPILRPPLSLTSNSLSFSLSLSTSFAGLRPAVPARRGLLRGLRRALLREKRGR